MDGRRESGSFRLISLAVPAGNTSFPLSGAHFCSVLRAMRGRNGQPKFSGMAKPKSPNTVLKRPSSLPRHRPRLSGTDQPDVKSAAGLPSDPDAPDAIPVTAASMTPAPGPTPATAMAAGTTAGGPKLLGRLRHALRVRHYSIRTESAYVDWVRRFILFHGKRHPADLGAAEVQAFLTHLAVDRSVASPTQNQAKSALLFLYREVLGLQLAWLDDIVGAKLARRLPVVLTPTEVRALLGHLTGTMGLVASLLYGTGTRLLECLRLRVKDVEFERREIVIRDGKGAKDRVTVLPENLVLPLQSHIARVRQLHLRDLAAGFGDVWLPDALDVKYPQASREWGWQWVFPSTVR